jgi:predicted metal-dependent HD superfamily phosphohydrolase
MHRALHIELAARLSFDAPDTFFARLRARYAEAHRHYHTWEHVIACLDARDAITEVRWPAVDLALLFHDAVYEPGAGDNEARSAALLVEEGRRAWIDEHLLQRASKLVEATRRDVQDADESEEACVLRDADLAILGAERPAFDAYEENVRLEHCSLDDATYAAGRRAVLRAFLDRPSIYATQAARRLWEERARANLARSLARLPA